MSFIIILGVDTATKVSGVALAYINSESVGSSHEAADFKILADIYSGGNVPHSESLCPMVDSVLKVANIELSDVDVFAVTTGPGSFTGIRIGVSLIKGLAFGNSNCMGISSLYALAYNFFDFAESDFNNLNSLRNENKTGTMRLLIAPAIDARRKQVYNALFTFGTDGKLEYVKRDRIITTGKLEEELNACEFAGSDIIFAGDGADMCYNDIKLDKVRKRYVSGILKQPGAASLCRLAASQLQAGVKPTHPRILSPSYLIKTQAEQEYVPHI